MIKVKKLFLNPKEFREFIFFSNNPHMIYIKNAEGFISYKGRLEKVREGTTIVIPALEQLNISLYAFDKHIELYLFVYLYKGKVIREKLYNNLSIVPNIDMYKRSFSLSLIRSDGDTCLSTIDLCRDLILRNLSSISCRTISTELMLSPQTLSRRLKPYGITCIDLILDLKLRRARLLLIRTSKSISEIAKGIDLHSNYFSIVFKNKFLVNPTKFRKEYKL
jgi:AraC-like DNA-binding protein